MGLDLNPLGKASAGNEEEFEQLFLDIGISSGDERQKKINRWFEIQLSPYETLNTPRIGIDKEATNWVLEHFRKPEETSETEEEHIQRYYGQYLPQLTPASDGVPIYSNSAINAAAIYSFRGQFIVDDCAEIVGEGIVNRLYTSLLAKDLVQLGEDLYQVAEQYSKENNVEFTENIATSDAEDKTPELNAHILFSAAKWCKFWGSRGHGFEADY
ncbi:hypothetical protein QE250_16705 [Chromatiaceae bacterium AAb-1]|nr:hypothetical protein [Chromatiaceae bacterium AAb-1]